MAQYIDKDALVAEIERRLVELSQLDKASYEIGLFDAYKIILSTIDTLEEPVSDDLKEVEAVIHPYDGEIWVNKDLLSTYDDCQRVKLLIIKEE